MSASPIPERRAGFKKEKLEASEGREAELKNSKWHFHRDPHAGILIHVLEKSNSKNIVPTI
jgi:hypothetical protein